jgi:RNA polymerase sigma-70 factor (ECF subfamily)
MMDSGAETLRKAVDAQCLAALYVEHAPGLRRLVIGVLRDSAAADDIVQATFAKAAGGAAELEPGGMKAWLYRVAFNEALTWKRRSGVAERATQALAQRRREGESPEEALARRETVDQVRELMQRLSADEQEVLRARVYQEKTFAQIAAETGLPLGTVLTRMRRALEKMRQALKDHDKPIQ